MVGGEGGRFPPLVSDDEDLSDLDTEQLMDDSD